MKQRVGRAMALVLLLMAAGFGSAAIVKADAATIAACMTLDDYPSISGVSGVLEGMLRAGYTPRQAAYKLGEAVGTVCPEHRDLVIRYANALDNSSGIA